MSVGDVRPESGINLDWESVPKEPTAGQELGSPYAICPTCGRKHEARTTAANCTCPDRSNLVVKMPLGRGVREALRRSTEANACPSHWRYAPLLPVDRRFGSPLPVGWTPLIEVKGGRRTRLILKDETRNPSGSLKDRATEIALAVAAKEGIRKVIAASTGNAAASLACLGAAMGFHTTILVPKRAPAAKLAQTRIFGANVIRVDGEYDDAYELAQMVSERYGIYNRSTGGNPFTREGKKTCAFEIAEQLQWRCPEWVVVPTGDGNIISGIWKGFYELFALGVTKAMPRLVAAQAHGANAISRLLRGDTDTSPIPQTIADSISVRFPRDSYMALHAIRSTDGFCIEVNESATIEAVRTLAQSHGVFVEPAAATAYAAASQLIMSDTPNPGDVVVCLLTGTGLKDIRPVERLFAGKDTPIVSRRDVTMFEREFSHD